MPVLNHLLPAAAVEPATAPDIPELDTSLEDFMAPAATAPVPNETAPARRRQRPASAVSFVASLSLERALGRDGWRLVRRGGPRVVMIQVPGPGWVSAVEAAVREIAGTNAMVVTATSKKTSSLSDESGRLIAKGSVLVGIAPAPDCLAPTLVAAADLQVTVRLPDAAIIAEAIRRWCRRRAGAYLTSRDLTGLALADYAAALRPRSSPEECVARLPAALRRASRRHRSPARQPERIWERAGLGAGGLSPRSSGLGPPAAGPSSNPACSMALLGPGKTLLAQFLARSAGIPILITSVAQWFANSPGFLESVVKQYVEFFEQLMLLASTPDGAVGFIDEVDAIPNRATISGHGTTWWTPVVTGILLDIERLRVAAPNVVLLAATNHIERVDSALLRPGRFDRLIPIAPPDEEGRAGILPTHLGPDMPDANLMQLARLCPDATGAVLATCVKAARRRARAAGCDLALEDLRAEIMPPDPRPVKELQAVALHGAGHAVVALRVGFGLPMSPSRHVISRRGMRGSSHRMPCRTGPRWRRRSSRSLPAAPPTKSSAGVARPPAQWWTCARRRAFASIHASFGLGATLAYRVSSDEAETLLRFDPKLTTIVDADLRRLMTRAVALVRQHEHAIRAVAGALAARRTLVGDEVARIIARGARHLHTRAGAAPEHLSGPA